MFMSYLYSKLPETGVPHRIGTGGSRGRVALHIWAIVLTRGGAFFVMKEFGSGGFTAAVAATNGLIGQLAAR
jgi:hypothetical protein